MHKQIFKIAPLLQTNSISSPNINIWNIFYQSRGRLSSPAVTQGDSAKRMLWLSCHLLLAISDNNTEELSPLALESPWPQGSNPVCLRQGSVWSSVSSVGSHLILHMSSQELALITVLYVRMGHRSCRDKTAYNTMTNMTTMHFLRAISKQF